MLLAFSLHGVQPNNFDGREPPTQGLSKIPSKILANLRPDVFATIINLYGNSIIKLQTALQTGEAYQLILNSGEDESSRHESGVAVSREVACRALRLEADEAEEMGSSIEALVFDSDKRVETYLQFNQFWSGKKIKPFPLSEGKACDI